MKIYNKNLLVDTILKNKGAAVWRNNEAVYIYDNENITILRLSFREWVEFRLEIKPVFDVTYMPYGFVMMYKN